MAGEQPPDRLLYSVGCLNKERCDYFTLDQMWARDISYISW